MGHSSCVCTCASHDGQIYPTFAMIYIMHATMIDRLMHIYHGMGHTMRLCMRVVRSSNSSGMLVDLRLRCLAARAAAPGDVCFSAAGSGGIPSAGAAGPAALRFACMSPG